MSESNALKDQFFQKYFFAELCVAIDAVFPAFDPAEFQALIYDDTWDGLALKEKMRHTTLALGAMLPDNFRIAVDILLDAAAEFTQHDFGSLIFSDFVEVYGLDDWDTSIAALEQFTQYMSAEYAIRPFILRYPERTLAKMLDWASHENVAVRRLASEGCRPRLPWGIALPPLKEDPEPIIPILDRLKLDEYETVRRSVANNLNDISKDNPDVVLDVLYDWRQVPDEKIAWITQHALRTLVKQGHPDALLLLGYTDDPQIEVWNLALDADRVPMGGEVTFSFDVRSVSDEDQDLMIDYVLHLMRKNGMQTPKVFKITKRTLAPGETITISKTQSFAPITTRTYYPGAHGITVQINGLHCGRVDFEVVDPA